MPAYLLTSRQMFVRSIGLPVREMNTASTQIYAHVAVLSSKTSPMQSDPEDIAMRLDPEGVKACSQGWSGAEPLGTGLLLHRSPGGASAVPLS